MCTFHVHKTLLPDQWPCINLICAGNILPGLCIYYAAQNVNDYIICHSVQLLLSKPQDENNVSKGGEAIWNISAEI